MHAPVDLEEITGVSDGGVPGDLELELALESRSFGKFRDVFLWPGLDDAVIRAAVAGRRPYQPDRKAFGAAAAERLDDQASAYGRFDRRSAWVIRAQRPRPCASWSGNSCASS